MASIVKIKDSSGEVQYPITKPECVIDENGKNVLQLIKENGGGSTPDLSEYLTKIEAEETYQPKGDYVEVERWTSTNMTMMDSINLNATELSQQKKSLTELSVEVGKLEEKVDELGEGVKEEVFWVEYGKTTYEDVKAAAESGKIVICVYNTMYYRLVSLRTDAAFLACDEGNYHYRLTISAANSGYASIYFNRGHNIKDLDNGNVEIEISGKKREVATPQYVESLLGTIINGDY